MHFWIDKRSQTYGFGRARVAASLSGAGGNGLGFPHPPRRMGGKSSLMPTIHRLPAAQQHLHNHGHQQQHHQQQQQQQQSIITDCHRPHSINNNNINNNNNNAHNSNHSHMNNNHHSNSNYNNGSNNLIANNNNNNNNSNSSSSTIVHYSSNRSNRGCRSSSINNATLNNNNHHEATTTLTSRSYHHHPQFGNMSIRHYQAQHSAATLADHSPYSSRIHHHHHHHNPTQRTSSSTSSATLVTSVPLPPIYVSPSHAQSLEEGAMGMGPISTVRLQQANATGTVTTTTSNSAHNNQTLDSVDAQMLPSHLKYGMWATLILASVFVAGAKFYADHQGTGLEVLIFAAFSATFFLAACTVSLCRLPSSLAASPSLSIDDSSRGLLNQHNNQLSLHYQPDQQHQQRENLDLTPTGAPPPYHIAILLPENGKELDFKDESPPPSYDKIVI